MADVTDPGNVDVVTQGFGLGLPADFRASNRFITPANASANNITTNVNGPGSLQPKVVDQGIVTGPAQTAPTGVSADASGNTKVVSVDQEIGVGPAQTAGTNVNGGTFSPTSPNVLNTTPNNVVGQTFGSGLPKNVNQG